MNKKEWCDFEKRFPRDPKVQRAIEAALPANKIERLRLIRDQSATRNIAVIVSADGTMYATLDESGEQVLLWDHL